MGVVHLRIGEELDVREVGALAPRLLDAVRAPVDVQLDLSTVRRFDTAGVQLLLLMRREARVAGARLRFVDVSEAVRELLRFYRLESVLEPAS